MQKASKKEKKKIVTVRMPEDLDQELNRLSKQSKKSVSQVIIEALRYSLSVKEKNL